MTKVVPSVFGHCMEMNFVFQFLASVLYIQNIVLKKTNITFTNQETNQPIQKTCKAYKELSGIVHYHVLATLLKMKNAPFTPYPGIKAMLSVSLSAWLYATKLIVT